MIHLEKRKQKKIIYILLFITAIVMFLSGSSLVGFHIEDKIAEQYWKNIANKKEKGVVLNDDTILDEYETLYKENSDIVGWLKIDGTKIDYPVMQNKESPEYYLRKNFNKEYDGCGTPFVDYRCDVLPEQSFNTIIYGHYSSGDRGFRWLFNYEAEYWYKEHKIIQFDTIQEKGNYEVVAVFYYDVTDVTLKESDDEKTEDVYEFYNYIEIDSGDGYRKFIDGIESKKLYETEAKIKMTDHLITLICCAPEAFSDIEENGRLVVIAKKI